MRWIYTFVFFCFAGISPAQDSLFSYFTADVTDNGTVLLRWEIISGSTCNGTEIQRSTDSIHFTTIYTIAGICGNSSAAVPYQYEDENPVANTTNYYRLLPGSGTPTRAVAVFFIEYAENGYYLFPNPASQNITIYFKNSDSENSVINLIDRGGQIIHTGTTNSDFFELNLAKIPSGIYFFSIELNGRLISGRFVKN